MSQKLGIFIARPNADDLGVLSELIVAGKVSHVIDATFTLKGVPEAIRHLEAGRAKGKLVISVP